MSSAARVRRHREREAAGLIVLQVVADEVRLLAVLQDAGLVGDDPSRTELAEVVSNWLEMLVTGYSKERWPD